MVSPEFASSEFSDQNALDDRAKTLLKKAGLLGECCGGQHLMFSAVRSGGLAGC